MTDYLSSTRTNFSIKKKNWLALTLVIHLYVLASRADLMTAKFGTPFFRSNNSFLVLPSQLCKSKQQSFLLTFNDFLVVPVEKVSNHISSFFGLWDRGWCCYGATIALFPIIFTHRCARFVVNEVEESGRKKNFCQHCSMKRSLPLWSTLVKKWI